MIGLVALISTLLGSVIGAAAFQVWDTDGQSGTATVSATTTAAPADEESSQGASLTDGCLTAADVYEQVRPAVVEITSTIGSGAPFSPRSEGTGTGIVIDAEGHILTNNHVVDGAQAIEVQFDDGSTASAELTGSDPANDLAVIQADVSGRDLAVAQLGDSDALRVGDPVLALGNPFNLEATLTQGIVSAIDRTYATGASTRPIREMIQTDAAVNPGNSGGPLLNCRGEVIGINTLLENPTGENVNVGVAFAVAVNTAKQSLSQMLAGETVSHAWLGIAGVDVTPALSEELSLDTDTGVYVTLVSADSPADDAGLEAAFASQNQAASSATVPAGGDVILAVDGVDVTGIDELAGYLDANKQPGDSVELTVIRDGSETSVQAELAEWPA
jgi:S1-C subfamily serine protease